MTETSTPFTVRTAAPGVCVIEIAGEVTRTSERALEDAYVRAADGAHAIILAFDRLEYMNSSGIGLLVTLVVRAKRNHQRMLACCLTDHYRQIFTLTRLDEVISVHESERAAIEAAV